MPEKRMLTLTNKAASMQVITALTIKIDRDFMTNNNGSTCPLCKQSNRCNVKASSGCWCMNTQVPKALLAKIPAHLKGKSCVCNLCIANYQQQLALESQVE